MLPVYAAPLPTPPPSSNCFMTAATAASAERVGHNPTYGVKVKAGHGSVHTVYAAKYDNFYLPSLRWCVMDQQNLGERTQEPSTIQVFTILIMQKALPQNLSEVPYVSAFSLARFSQVWSCKKHSQGHFPRISTRWVGSVSKIHCTPTDTAFSRVAGTLHNHVKAGKHVGVFVCAWLEMESLYHNRVHKYSSTRSRLQ